MKKGITLAATFFMLVCAIADEKSPKDDDKPKAFADVIKDAEAIRGLFTFYRKEDTVLLEVLPEQFERQFLCSPTLESGLGERSLLSAQMLSEFVFTLRRVGKRIQFIQKNVRYRADDNTPIQKAVKRSFADSILSSAKIESEPHPERKSVLVDLKDLLLLDLPLLGYELERVYRWPYKFDDKNSSFAMVKSFPQNTEIQTFLNFVIDRPPVPPLKPPTEPTPPPPVAPPDARSLPMRVHYSFSDLPQTAYKTRLADDRVGHFLAMHQNFTQDESHTPYIRHITRWHLEKAEPDAALSRPKEPIVFWLENTIPEKYRSGLREGVLIWNKAFERIGFKDAIVVKQQPDDADWDPADARYNTIRWFVATDTAFAIGPSRVNPFTGQIYDADIGFSENIPRLVRGEYEEFVDPVVGFAANNTPVAPQQPRSLCHAGGLACRQAAFGFNLLKARGVLPDAAAEDKFVEDLLVHVAAHEVGHTLGLRHNFRASTLHNADKLHDEKTTTELGLTGSVMDYIPVNVALPGQKQGQHWQTTLGTYDYWAIEYAYKPLKDEKTELAAIASRVADPKLAYSTDEDTFGWNPAPVGIDPRSSWGDLGTDPLPWYRERLLLVHELWDNMESKAARPGEGYQRLRRTFNQGLSELYWVSLNLSKFVGGIYHHRDHVDDPGGRSPYEPVPGPAQRQALGLLQEHLFGPKAFVFPAALLNKLASERFWDFEGTLFSDQRIDYPIHQFALETQRAILDRLFHPMLLTRLHDLEAKYSDPKNAFLLADLFQSLHDSIWTELNSGSPSTINSFRRGLQREHLKHLTRLVLKPAANTPEDAATLARHHLLRLQRSLQKASGKSAPTIVQAHLQETLARIDETLKAQQVRSVN